MIDHEVLYFIRDSMLTNPSTDAQFIYMTTHLAEKDTQLYSLLNEWAKDYSPRIEKLITDRVELLLTLDELGV